MYNSDIDCTHQQGEKITDELHIVYLTTDTLMQRSTEIYLSNGLAC